MFWYRFRSIVSWAVLLLLTLAALPIGGTLADFGRRLAGCQPLDAALHGSLTAVVVWLGITLLLGRVYCSIFCPLGIIQEYMAHLGRKHLGTSRGHAEERLALRIEILACFAALGAVFVFFGRKEWLRAFDPYTLYTKAVEAVVLLAKTAFHRQLPSGLAGDFCAAGLILVFFSLALTIAVSILALFKGRIFCNTVCPLGTILSLLGRLAPVRIRIKRAECVNCRRCASHCAASCIHVREKKIEAGCCTLCANCLKDCPKNAIGFGLSLRSAQPAEKQSGEQK